MVIGLAGCFEFRFPNAGLLGLPALVKRVAAHRALCLSRMGLSPASTKIGLVCELARIRMANQPDFSIL